jgi:hypothetical protein
MNVIKSRQHFAKKENLINVNHPLDEELFLFCSQE